MIPISRKRFGNNSGYNKTFNRIGERLKDDDNGDGDEDELKSLENKLLK